MTDVNSLVFLAGLLLLVGIASSRFAARLGVPLLVLFLGVGMVAGSDGLGGVAFADYALANHVASVALAFILFDGGLQTSWRSVRATWRPALALSTAGVVVTSAVTGLAATLVLGVPVLHGLLLGAIVGSTDAAAVFSVLRSSGLNLPDRLTATLEVESGANDPMAIFLTLGLIAVVQGGEGATPGALAALFGLQFGVGAAVGAGGGLAAAWLVNRINLGQAGLYPILATALGLLTFGAAAVLGGSGFLAVYLAGIVLGNSTLVFKRGILFFHDAIAWLAQLVMFVLLGLLSFPGRLVGVAGAGLGVAVVLVVVARPLAVWLSAAPFGFRPRELAFLSWVGLKGAVPITLATFPLVAGVPGAETIFDVVFFVVVVSVLVQGWSLPAVAKRLRLAEPADPPPPLSLEIHALRQVDGEIVDYTVAPSARVAGQTLRDLTLPDGVVMTLVVRGEELIVPRGSTRLRPGDHVFVALRSSLVPLMDRLFDPLAAVPPLPSGLTLAFHGASTVGQLHRFFGIPGPTWSTESLRDLVPRPADGAPAETPPVRHGPFLLAPEADDPEYVTLTYDPLPGDTSETEPLGLAAR